MGIHVVRFEKQGKEHWGVVRNLDEIHILKGEYPSLAAFLQDGLTEAKEEVEFNFDRNDWWCSTAFIAFYIRKTFEP
jgi:hypothetical protein